MSIIKQEGVSVSFKKTLGEVIVIIPIIYNIRIKIEDIFAADLSLSCEMIDTFEGFLQGFACITFYFGIFIYYFCFCLVVLLLLPLVVLLYMQNSSYILSENTYYLVSESSR